MTTFIVRSMSTTDYTGPGTVRPYHIYLRRPELRKGAYWAWKGEAQQFATKEEAQAEINRALGKPQYGHGPQIVPFNDEKLPTYWECTSLGADR